MESDTVIVPPIDSLALACRIARVCKENEIELNPTKLQKLLYICYGSVLGKFGFRLIDEYPIAGPYGPFFRESLRAVKFFGVDVFAEKEDSSFDTLPEVVANLVDEAIVRFGKHTGSDLCTWSKKKGSPWDKATLGGSKHYVQIPSFDIGLYFMENVLK